MCLMCEEEAFFAAYWEQMRNPPAGAGQGTPGADVPSPDPSRFTAVAIDQGADAASPSNGVPQTSSLDSPNEP